MKKLFLGPVFFFALFGCSKPLLDYRHAELSNGMIYNKGDDEPFTGLVTNIPLSALPTQSLAEMNQLARDLSEDKSLSDFFMTASIGSFLGRNSGSAALCDAAVEEGYLDGKVNCKTTSGQHKVADIEYAGGNIDGAVTLYSLKDESESILATADFVSGKLDGNLKIYGRKTNELVSETIWKNGNLDGEAKIYSKDTGELVAQGVLQGKSRQGKWEFFDPDTGKLTETATYKDGEVIESKPQNTADASSANLARLKAAVGGPASQPAQPTPGATNVSTHANQPNHLALNEAISQMVARQIAADGGAEYSGGRKVLESDFNGDQLPDAAVLYTIEGAGGGNSSFSTLALLLRLQDSYVEQGSVVVGGATDIALGTDDTILVTSLTHGPDDPNCCPSMKSTAQYRVKGNQLLSVP